MAKLTKTIMAVAIVVAATNVRAEDGPIDKLYGEGVHAFFSGDLEAAEKHLEASIAAGNRDPRCYYYRGLALSRMGKADAAKADLQAGAALEAQNPDLTSLVNRSIQRIQGMTRISLEKYRSDAQLTALATRKARDAQRYGARRASATEELRKRAAAGQGDAAATPKGTSPAAPNAAAPNAAAPDAAAPDAAAPDAAAPAENNPFGDDPMSEAATPDAATPDAAAPDAATPEAPMSEAEAPMVEAPMAEAPMEETPMTEEAPMGEAPMAETPDAAEAPMGETPATEENPDNLFGEEPAMP